MFFEKPQNLAKSPQIKIFYPLLNIGFSLIKCYFIKPTFVNNIFY